MFAENNEPTTDKVSKAQTTEAETRSASGVAPGYRPKRPVASREGDRRRARKAKMTADLNHVTLSGRLARTAQTPLGARRVRARSGVPLPRPRGRRRPRPHER